MEITQTSRETLQTYEAWGKAVYSFDHIIMFRLIQLTHQYGSSKSRMCQFKEFVRTDQASLPLDGYIGVLRPHFELTKSSFEDPNHPGFVSLDMIYKTVFLLGLNQTFFERPIQKLNDEKPDATAVEAMLAMQAYVRDYTGNLPLTAAGHVPRALVASGSGSGGVGSGGSIKGRLGPYDPKVHKMNCKHCWDNGLQRFHAWLDCFHRLRMLSPEARAKEKEKSRQAKDSKALVAPVSHTPDVVPVVAPVVTLAQPAPAPF